ncbi:Profilin-2 [Cladobotryum mycophilum]|uniref:Profilin n=1 Tax=Cladobotryum mycophilum TaxID=491253 RepID=A0ABR0T3U1_9HYPO
MSCTSTSTSITSSLAVLSVNDDNFLTIPQSIEYLDEQLLGCGAICQAGLYSYPDGKCLASSGNVVNTNITFQKCFERPTRFFTTGVTFNGVKYMTLRADDRLAFAQKKKSGIIVAKARNIVVVGVYDEVAEPVIAYQAVENLAAYLRSQGY